MNSLLFTGERVRLVAPDAQAEAEATARWQLDSEFQRLLDNEPARLNPVGRIRETLDEIYDKEKFVFNIRTLKENRLIGFVGLFGFQWAHGDAWLGIGIGERDCQGKGYGTDAMKVILGYAFAELNLHRVTLGVFEYNTRAIRSYEKAGFCVEGRMRKELARDGRLWDELIMGVLRDDWQRVVNRP